MATKTITILEGPDGVGKSTLAAAIAKKINGHVLHCTWNPNWDIEKYHATMMRAAQQLTSQGIPVILDRWAPSEEVYGEVLRGGGAYDTYKLIQYYTPPKYRWILCTHDDVVERHEKHKKERDEMFDSMEGIQEEFFRYASNTPELDWILYDYEKVDMDEFVNNYVKKYL